MRHTQTDDDDDDGRKIILLKDFTREKYFTTFI